MRLTAITVLLLSMAQGASGTPEQSPRPAEPVRRMAVTVDDLQASRSHALSLAQQQEFTRRGYTGPGGITWLHRWAITKGLDSAIFHGEPRVPEWVDGRSDP